MINTDNKTTQWVNNVSGVFKLDEPYQLHPAILLPQAIDVDKVSIFFR